MLTRILRFALLAALSLECRVALRAQVSTAGAGAMQKPPPVSGQSYRIETGMEERSNYISGGIGAGAGYIDNLYPGSTGSSTGPASEKLISLQPRIAFNTKSARLHASAAYNPTFIFYQPTSGLNEADHNGVFDFGYRFSPRFNVDVNDSLLRSSSGFGQIGTGISGSAPTPALIVGYAEHLFNIANAVASYQLSPHGMIGGLGDVGTLTYGGSSQTTGLYDSASRGGGGFYNHRLSGSQYVGAIYKYEQAFAYPQQGQYETQTHEIDAFYTIYLTETYSLSVAGGPQHYRATDPLAPTTQSWSPAITASMGRRSPHASFAASFSRTVTGGGGLIGAFYTTSAGAEGVWQFSRLWDAALNVGYNINNNAAPLNGLTSPGGHTFATSLSLGRNISPHVNATLRYDRIQNHYDGIPAVVNNPNADRIMVSYFWDFQRPVGR